jgi:hypothetical protein
MPKIEIDIPQQLCTPKQFWSAVENGNVEQIQQLNYSSFHLKMRSSQHGVLLDNVTPLQFSSRA